MHLHTRHTISSIQTLTAVKNDCDLEYTKRDHWVQGLRAPRDGPARDGGRGREEGRGAAREGAERGDGVAG